MEVKVGDIVHVRCIVVRLGEPGADLTVVRILTRNDYGVDIWTADNNIVHVEPQPLKVGDVVRHRSMDWNVLAVNDEQVWLRREDNYASIHRDEAQRYS